jgi:hypothetical protein
MLRVLCFWFVFQIGCPTLPQVGLESISTSWIAGITSMNHQVQPTFFFLQCWRSNPKPYACCASTFTTQLHPQPFSFRCMYVSTRLWCKMCILLKSEFESYWVIMWPLRPFPNLTSYEFLWPARKSPLYPLKEQGSQPNDYSKALIITITIFGRDWTQGFSFMLLSLESCPQPFCFWDRVSLALPGMVLNS